MRCKDTIILTFNHSDYMAAPFIRRGYKIQMVDPLFGMTTDDGVVHRIAMTMLEALEAGILRFDRCALIGGFPVCTDVAVSGTRHWEVKKEADPYFQAKAAILGEQHRTACLVSGAKWFMENPVSAYSSIFGKPDYTFNPHDYGGYLPENDMHPDYPEYFPPQDAYPKTTCLWTGGGFIMPEKRPVECDLENSHIYTQLGGKSQRTKTIRSSTPRGFAEAVAAANVPVLTELTYA